MERSESDLAAQEILEAWRELEEALRTRLPSCAPAPPSQPGELVTALRLLGGLGPQEEVEIEELRRERNRVAHTPQAPSRDQVRRYRQRIAVLMERLGAFPPRPPEVPNGIRN